jgi:acetylornithine/succinyldiaminopimelate/putrescine aminotransferase
MPTDRQLFLNHLGQTTPYPMMVEIVRAEGVWMYGPSGEKYLDLISGVSVSNTGHRHPEVVKAIKDQVDSYLHLMVYGEMIQSPQVRYAERLISVLPSGLESCYFVNSGSEAVEGALKLAKRYTGKSRIISFRNSYHGSTHGALSIQGSETYKNGFRPLLPDIYLGDFNSERSLDLIDNKTACVIVEPVQAEAGIIFPTDGFLYKLRRKCTETGSLLVFDEVQTGFGRLGSLFASEKFGVTPDIMVLAKAMGGGLPLGAFISSHKIMSSLMHDPPLGHITTFGGHPVCCAAGLASLDILIRDKLSEKALIKSDLIKEGLIHPAIREIRGEGLLLAAVTGNSELTQSVIVNAPRYGLILDYFLFCPEAFRIAPPLTITDEEINFACTQLKKLLDDIINKRLK